MGEIQDNRHVRRYKTASRILSIAVTVIGAVSLAGWIFDIALFRDFFQIFIYQKMLSMRPNAALCLVLSGIALWLMQEEKPDGRNILIIRAIGYFVAAAGFLTMTEFITGFSLGIDGLLFRNYQDTVNAGIFGIRMTADTALAFLITGICFILFDKETESGFRPGQQLMLGLGSVALIILFSYFYILVYGFDVTFHTPMSFGSSIAFLAVFFSYIFARPRAGVMAYFIGDDIASITARSLVPAIIFAPLTVELLTFAARNAGAINPLHENMLRAFMIVLVFFVILLWIVEMLKRIEGEREDAWSELRRSEERLKGFFSSSPNAIVLSDINGKMIDCNNMFLKMHGFASKEEVIGMDSSLLLAPEARAVASKNMEAIFAKGSVLNIQLPMLKKDGSRFDGEFSSSIIVDHEGKPIGLATVSSDISERKKSEREIASAKEFAENLIETANAMVVGLDISGSVTIFNKAAEDITGYSKEDLNGRNWFEVLVPKDRYPQVWDTFNRLISGGFIRKFENPILTRSGEERYILWQNNQLREGERITGTVSFGIDITEIKKAEKELENYKQNLEDLVRERTSQLEARTSELEKEIGDRTKAENQLNYLIESLPGSFYLYDVINNRLVKWNKYLEEKSGYSGNELAEIKLMSLISEKDRERFIVEMGKAVETGRAEGEADHVTKDGLLVPSYFTGTRIDLDGRPHIIGMAIDITERKRIEDELVKARDMAESASRAKSSFLANMSHELRTPLNSIIGFSDVLREGMSGQLNEKQREYVDIIIDSGRHLLSLIDDILDLSKIEAGRIDLRISSFNMKNLIENCINLVSERAAKRSIDIIKSLSEAEVQVSADERMIRQVIYNLLSNAIKFTPDVGRIGIEVHKKEHEIQVTVWDSGIGIDLDYKGNIFREFEQVESGYTRKYEGSGLGLAISKKLVELHHGRIWFGSEGRDKGAKFSFTVPLKYEGEKN